jgi:hypothetical protein
MDNTLRKLISYHLNAFSLLMHYAEKNGHETDDDLEQLWAKISLFLEWFDKEEE